MIRVNLKEFQEYIERRLTEGNKRLHYVAGDTEVEEALLAYLAGQPIFLVDKQGKEHLFQMTEEQYIWFLDHFFPGRHPEEISADEYES